MYFSHMAGSTAPQHKRIQCFINSGKSSASADLIFHRFIPTFHIAPHYFPTIYDESGLSGINLQKSVAHDPIYMRKSEGLC